MANELGIGHEWLYDLLSNDAQLLAELADPPVEIAGESIYFDVVPQEIEVTEQPIVLIRHLPMREDADFITINGTRIWTRGRLRIVAAASLRDYDALGPAADRLDALLNRASGVTGQGRVVYVLRKAAYIRAYNDEEGREMRELGGEFEWAIRNGLN